MQFIFTKIHTSVQWLPNSLTMYLCKLTNVKKVERMSQKVNKEDGKEERNYRDFGG